MIVEEFKIKKKINFKLIIIVAIILVLVITFIVLYKYVSCFRNKVNELLKFTVESENSLTTIYIEQDAVNEIFGYDKYFSVLFQNTLQGYTDTDKIKFSHEVNINDCISSDKGKYLALCEKDMKFFYLLCEKKVVYEKEISENISNIYVNKNGYVALCCKKNGYRSIIKLFNPNGEEIFTTFLANTYASDVCISDNNKYLAISEIDTTGINIQSSIKIIEISKANSEDYIINIDTEPNLISHIKFINNMELIYLTNAEIKKVDLEKNKENIYTINSNIVNADISLGNHIILVEKNTSSLFNTDTDIVILNKEGSEIGRYTLQGSVKQIIAKDNIICANVGQKLYFLTMTGRPLKEYSTSLDVRKVIIFDNGNKAGIIYRNKIEIISI